MAWLDDLHDFFGASQLERVSFGKTGIFFFSEHRNQVCIAVLTFHSSFFARFMCRFMTRVVESDSTLFLSLATLWSVSYFVETTAEVKRNLNCVGDSENKYVELLIKKQAFRNELYSWTPTIFGNTSHLDTRDILVMNFSIQFPENVWMHLSLEENRVRNIKLQSLHWTFSVRFDHKNFFFVVF